MSKSLQRVGKLWLKCSSSLGIRVSPALLDRRYSPCAAVALKAAQNCPSFTNYQTRNYSSEKKPPTVSKEEERIQYFIDPEVQALLKELTGRDLKRIFRKRKVGQKLKEPKYSFMTEAQLEEARLEAQKKADMLLQMPPVLKARQPIDQLLEFDPCIQGEERSTLIFTDISMNVSNRDRIIVARDPDGTLRQATWEERDKMNSIYFPSPGREFIVPKMFSRPEIFQSVLDRASEEDNTYEFVLDRACLQFEPDDPLYVSIVESTYDAIDKRAHYNFLKSTRHFGPMVFYLTRVRKMDGILLHSINEGRVLSDAVNLVSLFHILFPESKSKLRSASGGVEKLQNYIQLDAIKKGELELALNAYLEEEESKAELEQGLKRQHGLQA